jgi:hypothetical protein
VSREARSTGPFDIEIQWPRMAAPHCREGGESMCTYTKDGKSRFAVAGR